MFCTFYHAKRTHDKLLEDVKLLEESRFSALGVNDSIDCPLLGICGKHNLLNLTGGIMRMWFVCSRIAFTLIFLKTQR